MGESWSWRRPSSIEEVEWSWRSALDKAFWWFWSRLPGWSRFTLFVGVGLYVWILALEQAVSGEFWAGYPWPWWVDAVAVLVGVFLFYEVAIVGFGVLEEALDGEPEGYEAEAAQGALERLELKVEAHGAIDDPEVIVHRSDLERVVDRARGREP